MSSDLTKLMATPFLPNRPDRPILQRVTHNDMRKHEQPQVVMHESNNNAKSHLGENYNLATLFIIHIIHYLYI